MGWPKKDDLRLYFERAKKTYLLIDPNSRCPDGSYEAEGELLIDNNPESPCLCSTSASPIYLYQKCRRAQWSDMPPIWQKAMAEYVNGDPQTVKGLWRLPHDYSTRSNQQ